MCLRLVAFMGGLGGGNVITCSLTLIFKKEAQGHLMSIRHPRAKPGSRAPQGPGMMVGGAVALGAFLRGPYPNPLASQTLPDEPACGGSADAVQDFFCTCAYLPQCIYFFIQ